MRRSICVVEPSAAYAGDVGSWKFSYTTSLPLPKGTKLRFDLESMGRPLDWQIPTPNPKEKKARLFVELPGGKLLGGDLLSTSSYEFTLPLELKPGDLIALHLVDTACQRLIQRRRPFNLFIDPKGKGDYKDPETFTLDVRGNHLKSLRIIAPTLVSRNKRFDVIVRFEDQYGNLTSRAPEGTLIELTYENLRENLNWKLFVPETGFIALPNLYFNEPGIYRIQLKNQKTGELSFSPPIQCLAETPYTLLWGLLHGESERIDASEHIETFLRTMRDDQAFQFIATSPFESEEETSPDLWRTLSAQIAEFNEDDRFVTLLGFQWAGDPKTEGLRQIVYTKDARPLLRRKDSKSNALKKIYKSHSPKDMVAIPSTTMGSRTPFVFDEFQPEYERVVEIYNAWGSSECTAKAGNPRPIIGNKQGMIEVADGSIVDALNRGYRFGFTAGGFDDRGIFAGLYEADQKQYSPGLTAILAKGFNRAGAIEALQNRSTYATTGERMIVSLQIAGHPMGAILDTQTRPGLEYNRHIQVIAVGTQPLLEVAIIRNGAVWKKLPVNGERLDTALDDTDLLGDIAFEAPLNAAPFAYYYLRVTQKDGHIAWSSPIWVDLTSRSAPPTLGLKKPKKR